MKRYTDVTDAIPHESNVLVVSGTEEIYGEDFEEIFDDIRSDALCDRHYVEDHYYDLTELSDHESLIQHAVWVVHQSVLLGRNAHIEYYLDTQRFPDETQVLICLDGDPDAHRAVERKWGDTYPIITERTQLHHYLLGYLNAVNPCNLAGLEYIVRWNNEVCDSLGTL
jgi:hypothetical protein